MILATCNGIYCRFWQQAAYLAQCINAFNCLSLSVLLAFCCAHKLTYVV